MKEDTIQGLVALGYRESKARESVEKVFVNREIKSVEEAIKLALRQL